jgi:protein-S-isoprenylcysteine O-methyltransferase Ste14
MAVNAYQVIRWAWAALGLVWLAGLAFTKPAVSRQPGSWRLFHLALGVLGFLLIGGMGLQQGWMNMRFVPEIALVAETGALLTVAGCSFAIWARIVLGGNWSGRVTVKAAHELITRGPYALSRHPIYTGMLTALAGSALVVGEWRALAGLAIFVLAFAVKMSQEERLMMQTFPAAYPLYRQRVKALIPGIL